LKKDFDLFCLVIERESNTHCPTDMTEPQKPANNGSAQPEKRARIGFVHDLKHFTENGLPITDFHARKHWDATGSADWTHGAFNEMVKLVVTPNQKNP